MHRLNTRADRYARQRQFAPIGAEGQSAIQSSAVTIIGCGALGSVAAEILARAGVGRLRLIDRDVVQWSNLQRQSLFTEADAEAAVAKADAIATHLSAINSEIEIAPVVADLVPSNFATTVGTPDLVIDAVDNFPLRMLLNDWSLSTSTPWVHGGCVGAAGQIRLFGGDGRPCFRCLVPTVPPASAVQTCDTAGVVGAATHAIASLQCIEALKWLSGNRDAVVAPVQSFDFWAGRRRTVTLAADLGDDCPACRGRYDYLDGEAGAAMESSAVVCGRNSVQLTGHGAVDLEVVVRGWRGLGEISRNRFFARLRTDDHVVTLFRDGRVLIDGTDDVTAAKMVATRYLG